MTNTQSTQLVPFAENLLQVLAVQLLHDHQAQLPRLDHLVVLLPDMEAAPRLRRHLLQQAANQGHEALLGPRITTLRSWLREQAAPLPHEVVSEHQRTLILVAALREHRGLFGDGNLWALADSLLSLFDELTLNQVTLPQDLNDFTRTIASGYGLTDRHPSALDRETRLIHTLWHAWHEQLHARQLIDRNTYTLLQLSHALQQPSGDSIYLAGILPQSRAESQWLKEMVQEHGMRVLLQAEGGEAPEQSYHPRTPIYTLLDSLQQPLPERILGDAANTLFDLIYQPDNDTRSLRERALHYAEQHPCSPLQDWVSLFHADGDEQEAQAVDLQVRHWLLQGHRHIGIVTENRRLARRVRALLERSGITLHDASGWALSTTRAAATLEHWLQCVEEDFSHLPLLDLLKSPFITTTDEREEHLKRVYRLEQDIVLHENIGNGLSRYRQQTNYRQHRLPEELAAGLDGVLQLLDHLDKASTHLLTLLRGEHPVSNYIDTLLDSLDTLSLTLGLSVDEAGARLLDELQQMQRAVEGERQPLSWQEFRSWLGQVLEQSHFRLPNQGESVSLMGLGQSPLQHFDALILAGMEREFMPGAPASSPFFNDAVRRELKLPSSEERLAERFYHYRRLLESSDHLLITLRHLQDGEEILPSPWLEALKSFHQLAYDDGLEDKTLAHWLAESDFQMVDRSTTLPNTTQAPAPHIAPQLVPKHYSASTYQQLMNCPYQFYAARGLRLAPPEAIREALEKSDYGERVHRILQAFHGDVKHLPGPFPKRLEVQTLAEAQELLENISHAVFAEDLEDNFLHRGWLQRWLEKIPDYLAWQMAREEAGRVKTVEADLRTEGFAPQMEIQGRLDRIDHQHDTLSVVDYKTGSSASEEEVLSGEAVQLPFYATLAQQCQLPVERVEYLALDEKKLDSKVVLEGEVLQQLSDGVAERLKLLHEEMVQSARMPAWGDKTTCGYCHMEGLCRRSLWESDREEITGNKKGD